MTSITTGRIVFAAAALTSILAAGSCRNSEGMQCDTATETVFCPEGTHCAARTAQCITGLCGNGVRDPGEACDDGGTRNNDSPDNVTTCNETCTSDETCGNGILDLSNRPPEVCDCKIDQDTGEKRCQPPEATGCILTGPDRCRSNGLCGNHEFDPGEQCEFTSGVPIDKYDCDNDCSLPQHGDGHVNGSIGEQCDRNDDNVPGDSDGDGTLDCQSATCNMECKPSWCGDGVPNPLDTDEDPSGEQCDEGNLNRVHGTCDLHCIKNVCGDWDRNDSVFNGHLIEECDSDASFRCGTCHPAGTPSQCKARPPEGAVGRITVNSTVGLEGVVVQVTDGVNRVTRTYEYALPANIPDTGVLANGHLAIGIVANDVNGTAGNTEARIGNDIDRIRADTESGNQVRLTNEDPGLAGNREIVVTNNDAGAIGVLDMTGGTGCRTGDPCDMDTDCVASRCNRTTHQCE